MPERPAASRLDEGRIRSTRLDVLDALERAAKMSLEYHDTYVSLISGAVVNERSEWSDPVQFRLVPENSGFVKIEVRRVP